MPASKRPVSAGTMAGPSSRKKSKRAAKPADVVTMPASKRPVSAGAMAGPSSRKKSKRAAQPADTHEEPRDATVLPLDELQQRARANVILDLPGMLYHYALANGTTPWRCRDYFQRVALGIPTDPVIKHWFPGPGPGS